MKIDELYSIFLNHPDVTTDTRDIRPGCIFFALKGEKFDGNQFYENALKQGASYVVVDDPSIPDGAYIIQVDNVLSTFQELAGYHRRNLNIPVIAITGSNGKTTTKELIHAVLSTTFRTSTTKGNLNNHIGIPLTLLRIPADTEIAVVEMGANHQKEIAGYCSYTLPTHGLITNCGKAHLEGFGGLEGVRKGKGELFDYIKMVDGQAFVCSDFEYFHNMVKQREMKDVIWYGINGNPEVKGKVIAAAPFIEVEITIEKEQKANLQTNLVGDYNIYNVLAATIIGKHFKVPIEKIRDAIQQYQPDNSRSQLLEKEGNRIIMDAYNANPTSMAAAITNFASLPSDKKILILGAMAELGEDSLQEHLAIVNLIQKYSWDLVTLVGGDFGNIEHPFTYFSSAGEAAKWWQSQHIKGATILLKGSRSTAMEKVLGF